MEENLCMCVHFAVRSHEERVVDQTMQSMKKKMEKCCDVVLYCTVLFVGRHMGC